MGEDRWALSRNGKLTRCHTELTSPTTRLNRVFVYHPSWQKGAKRPGSACRFVPANMAGFCLPIWAYSAAVLGAVLLSPP
jgi:hypothetical protein